MSFRSGPSRLGVDGRRGPFGQNEDGDGKRFR